MHSGDLTPDQAGKLHDQLEPAFSYLAALQTRMDKRGFSRADRLYQEVAAARYAMQLLVNDLHRLRCGTGYASWKAD